jgi:hypothetical protein
MDTPQLNAERETTWKERLVFLATTPVCISPLLQFLFTLCLSVTWNHQLPLCPPLVGNVTCFCESERQRLVPSFLLAGASFILFVFLWSLPNIPQRFRCHLAQFKPAPGDVFCFDFLTLVSLAGLSCFTVSAIQLYAMEYYVLCDPTLPAFAHSLAWILLVLGVICSLIPLIIFASRLYRRLRKRPLFEE